jgi:small subunit ribosomal protein S1
MTETNQPNPRINLDAKLEAEIEAALGDMSLDDMMEVAERPSRAVPRGASGGQDAASAPGEERAFRKGTVIAIHGNDVMVEFGPKSQGVCPIIQFAEHPKPGDQMEFMVDRFDPVEGLLVLSREGVMRKAAWESLGVGQLVEARCTGVNKGGLEMEIAQHRAFMPAGQVDLRHVADLSVFIGEKLPCEVLELDRQRGRIILSRRSALEAERKLTREKLLNELEVGRQMPAVITSLQAYGAFADLGGIDGLIHISDIAYERLHHPSERLKVGEQVEVKVLKIARDADPPRISLGMKQCMADPLKAKLEEIAPGQSVSGKVTKIAPFGAFVELAPGVEGLIHISELSHDRIHKVTQVVKLDEVVTVKVLSVDPASRRISLSLKALKEKREEEQLDRGEDPNMKRLKAQLTKKFGPLKGGIG